MLRTALNQQKGASNREARLINRNLIFNLVRAHEPISRADLARVSGLQRSTVSLSIEELIADGWICESTPIKTPRGRRPIYLQMNPKRVVIAVDIHPIRAVLAIVNLAREIISQHVLPLPQNPEKALQKIIGDIRQMATQDYLFDGIGICLPGRTDLSHDRLVFAPNLKWPTTDIKARIESATGLCVAMDNVANACTLSEIWFSSSAKTQNIVLIEVSEGIGSGIYTNGALLRGKDGMAGEVGHVQIEPDGPICGCGNRGCWEVMASNRSAVRYYTELGGTEDYPNFDMVLRLAHENDAAAVAALHKMALYLGRGMRIIASICAPDEIVVVGEVTMAWPIIDSIIEAELRRPVTTSLPKVRPSYDGTLVRLRSAMALILNEQYQHLY